MGGVGVFLAQTGRKSKRKIRGFLGGTGGGGRIGLCRVAGIFGGVFVFIYEQGFLSLFAWRYLTGALHNDKNIFILNIFIL